MKRKENESYSVGLVSDTHGLMRDEALDALSGCRMIIHAGDVGKEYVLHLLREIAPVIAVRGNVDLGGWAWELSEAEVVQLDGTLIYVLHDQSKLELNPAAAGLHAVIHGHSHQPGLEEKNGVLYINPGSVGPRRFNLPVSLARMSIQEGGRVKVKFIELQV